MSNTTAAILVPATAILILSIQLLLCFRARAGGNIGGFVRRFYAAVIDRRQRLARLGVLALCAVGGNAARRLRSRLGDMGNIKGDKTQEKQLTDTPLTP